MPEVFIRLPAKMKKGTANNGKLSMPDTMRWITTNGGELGTHHRYSRAAAAMAMATGKPPLSNTRKMIFNMAYMFSGRSNTLWPWRQWRFNTPTERSVISTKASKTTPYTRFIGKSTTVIW